MGEYEDSVARLRDEGLDDLAETFEKFGATQLRQKAAKVEQLEADLAEKDQKILALEAAPKITEAFRTAGVDFEQLRPAELEALKTVKLGDDGEVSAEAVSEAIARLQLPIVASGAEGEEAEEGSDEEPNAAGIVQAATNAPRNTGGVPQVTVEDVANWSHEKWARFKEQNPEAAEVILAGESVTGVAAR